MSTSHPPKAPRLLWRSLWGWTLLASLAIWFTLAGMAYYTGLHEAEEITDGQLVSTAELLVRQAGLGELYPFDLTPHQFARSPFASGYAPELRVVVWEGSTLAWDTHGMAASLPPSLVAGHHTLALSIAGEVRTWRVFVADTAGPGALPRRVAVMVDTHRHAALARDIAEHIVRPALVLLPLVALLLAWAIRRGLRPLNQLSNAIGTLDVDAGETLPARQPFRELSSTVHAINALVERLQAQWLRERRFTSDVAHELRTPLAAMVLQARLAREGDTEDVRAAALRQIEHDALRTGRILSQLLDLARAQGLDAGAEQPVDLCTLARQVTSEHVPLAHELGQELSLEAPEPALTVSGRAAMLALALRNLVDNALRHTPPGTQVAVRVATGDGGAVALSVSDDGARHGPPSSARAGMGVGLTLVQRIADAHGIQLRHDAGVPPFTTRYALVWPANPTQR